MKIRNHPNKEEYRNGRVAFILICFFVSIISTSIISTLIFALIVSMPEDIELYHLIIPIIIPLAITQIVLWSLLVIPIIAVLRINFSVFFIINNNNKIRLDHAIFSGAVMYLAIYQAPHMCALGMLSGYLLTTFFNRVWPVVRCPFLGSTLGFKDPSRK